MKADRRVRAPAPILTKVCATIAPPFHRKKLNSINAFYRSLGGGAE
ncbi:hypothetical protein [Sphingobacterium sp. xlx-130]|nr:hypothetical protein [Sphingobacterium sp. xlx-130]